jgi:hypothetical protein
VHWKFAIFAIDANVNILLDKNHDGTLFQQAWPGSENPTGTIYVIL